jgi:hypothetical protein
MSVPETYRDEDIVAEMTEEQGAVMYGPYSNHRGEVPLLDVTENGTVYIENKNYSEAHKPKAS